MKLNSYKFLTIPLILFTFFTASADPYICLTAGGQGCWYRGVTEPIYRCSGETVNLYARTTGALGGANPVCDNPSYQWYQLVNNNGFLIESILGGQTGNMITVTQAGIYLCRVACTGGSYYWTGTATVYMSSQDPVVTLDPTPVQKCLGESVIFSSLATADQVWYQWQVKVPLGNWTDIPDAKSKNLNFIPSAEENQNEYRCEAYNGCNTDISNPALLTVYTAPEVILNPENDSVCENSAAGFFVSVTGSGLVYRWQERISGNSEWHFLSSAGNYAFDQAGNLTVKSASAGMDGYQYRVIDTGFCAPGDTSLEAELLIKKQPSVSMQPANDTACVGENAHFEILANGTNPLLFKWQKGGKTVKDWGTENYLDIEEVSLDDNQKVLVLVSDKCYSTSNPVSSDEASLVVDPPPFVSLGPDKRICYGTITELNPGSGYSGYSWSNGDSTQTIEVVDQGSYTVIVKGLNGCMAEDAIYIIVDPPIADVNLGDDSSYCSGEQVTLDAGAGYDAYEWFDGSTGQTLKISSTTAVWVKATNNNTVCEATDSVNILIAEPFAASEICLITIDQATGRYLLVWERTADVGIAQYNLYRESQWIGSLAYDDLSIFKDLEANPEKRPYKYEMTITDTCGNESGFTPYHIPIFLQYSGFIDGVNLSWSKYQVEGSEVDFDSYSVYKGSDSTQLAPFEENIPTEVSVYIDKDVATLEKSFYYRVAGVLSEPCNPSGGSTKAGTGPYHHSLSNMDDNKLKATNAENVMVFSPMTVYPNPVSDIATVRFSNPDSRKYAFRITDISGKTLRFIDEISSSEFKFNVKDLNPGYYHLILTGDQLFHGNIIVK